MINITYPAAADVGTVDSSLTYTRCIFFTRETYEKYGTSVALNR